MFIFSIWGIGLICIGIIILVRTKKPHENCKLPLYATCTGYEHARGVRGERLYVPMFEYWFNGREYLAISKSSIGSCDLQRYRPGTVHPIWINENDPYVMISDQNYSRREKLNLMIAGICLFHGISLTITGIILVICFGSFFVFLS